MDANTRPPDPPSSGSGTRLVPRTATAVLTWGLQVGIVLLTVGLALAAINGEPLASSVGRPSEVMEAVAEFDANGIVDLAILWMIAVPVIAAAAISGAFLRAREWRYLLVTLLVLAVLAFSIGLAVL
jgi:uncharacterized membrane protein